MSHHPTSGLCAKAIGADFYGIPKKRRGNSIVSFFSAIYLGLTLPRYNTYLVESTLSVVVPWIRRLLLREKNTIIHRANGNEYAVLLDIQHESKIIKYVYKFLLSKIDYYLPISSLVSQQIQDSLNAKSEQIMIIPTFVVDDDYFDIGKKQETRQDNFLFVGNYDERFDYKGIRELISFFEKLYDQGILKNEILYILGKNTEMLQKTIKTKNIRCVGYEDPKEYISLCTYYVHNAHMEAGGASVLEAVAGGLLPLVSDMTGNKDLFTKEQYSEHVFQKGSWSSFSFHIKKLLAMSASQQLQRKRQLQDQVIKNFNRGCVQDRYRSLDIFKS